MFDKPEPDQNPTMLKGKSVKLPKLDVDKIDTSDRFFDDLDEAALNKYATTRSQTP